MHRRQLKVPITFKKDSVYKPIVRTERQFGKLKIPAKLQAALPFASKPKLQRPVNRESYLQRRAVIQEPEERKARAVVQMLGSLRKDKMDKRHVASQLRSTQKRKIKDREEGRFEEVSKEVKRSKYRDEGKEKLQKERRSSSSSSRSKGGQQQKQHRKSKSKAKK